MPVPHQDHHYYIEEGFRKGNRHRIQEIYDRFLGQLKGWMKNNQGTIKDAEDVFQYSMMVLTISAGKEGFCLNCPLGAFLFVIWKHHWRDRLRGRLKLQELQFTILAQYEQDIHLAEPLAERAHSEAICFQLLDKTFLELSATCRQLLELDKQSKPVEEIAQTLNMSNRNTVYRRKFACIERWRSLIHREPDFDHCKNMTQ